MSKKRKLYKIHKFDFDLLFKYGIIDEDNGVLLCNEMCCEYAEKLNEKTFEVDKKGDCQLFNQTRKALNIVEDDEAIFESVFVNIDFSNHIKSDSLVNSLRTIPNGIKIYINKKELHFVDFLKSNSMSKNCCVYFINKELKDVIEPRITFNLNKGKMILSKWYAYSGLAISDAVILDDIKIKENELVIIPDQEEGTEIECITALSVPLVLDKIENIHKSLIDLKKLGIDFDTVISAFKNDDMEIKYVKGHIQNIKLIEKEINCYYYSKDYIRIKEETSSNKKIEFNRKHIIYLLEKLNNFSKYSFYAINEIIKKIKEEYKNFKLLEKNHLLDEYKENEVYWEKFHVCNYPVLINKFDGEGFIDKQLSKKINILLDDENVDFNNEEDNIDWILSETFNLNEIKNKKGYSFQIRLPFIKGMVHACDFKRFFKDKGIDKIYGKTYDGNKLKEYSIDEVKIILTESQFKASGFINNIERLQNESPLSAFLKLMNKYDYSLAISNLEPRQDNKIKLNYQFVSTIPFDNRDLKDIVELNAKQFSFDVSNNKVAENLISFEDERNVFEANKDFYFSTTKFKKRQDKAINDKKRELLKIKLDCPGYRKLICGDLLELLYHCAYHNLAEDYKVEKLNLFEFYAPNTKIKSKENVTERCMLLRNPHYSRNEIAVLRPMHESQENERIKYFKHLTGVIMFNPLSLTAERLGGADYDGDTLILLVNRYRGNTIKKLFNKEGKPLYPLIRIPSLQTDKVMYDYQNIIESFENTFSSRVGLISNKSIHHSFVAYKSGEKDDEEKMPLYTILSGLEIDSAKKGVKPYLIETEPNMNAQTFLNFNNELKNEGIVLADWLEKISSLEKEHKLFYLCKEIFGFDVDRTHKDTIISFKGVYDENEILDAISVFLVYEDIMSIKKMFRKYNNVEIQKNRLIKSILNNINHILHLKKIVDKKVLDFFESVNAQALLKIYCDNEQKFHFLKNEKDKKIYIKETLMLDAIPNEVMDIIIDFDNKGLYLLYILLYYWSECDKKKSIKYYKETLGNEKLYEDVKNLFNRYLTIKELSTSEIHYINGKITNLKSQIAREIENYGPLKSFNKEIDRIEKITIKILKNEASTISPDACLQIIKNLKASNIIFDVFSNHLVEILKREEVMINV